MSRQQLADFSAFLMQWISDSANRTRITDAITKAINDYIEDRSTSTTVSEAFEHIFAEEDAKALSSFNESEFLQLIEKINPLYQTGLSAQRSNANPRFELAQRLILMSQEHKRTHADAVAPSRGFTITSEHEIWRRAIFSAKELHLLREILRASADLSAKLPAELTDSKDRNFQFFLEEAKKAVSRVGDAVKTVSVVAYSNVVELTSANSAAFFQDTSPASPNAKDFLLSIDRKQGKWEVAGSTLIPNRTSLKTRMIYEVCRAYFIEKRVDSDPLAGAALASEEMNDFLDITNEIAENLQREEEQRRHEIQLPRRNIKPMTFLDKEVTLLKLFGANVIDPLNKPGHAIQIYEALLAIEAYDNMLHLRQTMNADATHSNTMSSAAKSSVKEPPQLVVAPSFPSVQLDDDCLDPNDNRSTARFPRT